MGKAKLPNPCRYAAAMQKQLEAEAAPAADVMSPAFARTSKVPS
jgi:hypothetical protein